MIELNVITGDLLDQKVDAIVNAWNRNIIPWWLLLPQGVSGAIKKRGGLAPFKELAKVGSIPLGGAVLTNAGCLPHKGIIHVAGINMLWRATEKSIQKSVTSAMEIVNQHKFKSVAFPILGAGTGSLKRDRSLKIMQDQLQQFDSDAEVIIVKYNQVV